MDIARAFRFVSEDEEWVTKLAIALLVSLLSFLIVPIPLLIGYAVGVTRNVKNGLDHPLPDWNDLGGLFRDGLSIIVAQLIYTLPFWLLACIVFFATLGFGGLSEAVQDPDILGAGIAATVALTACVAIIFAVAIMFISPAIVLQYVATDDLGATLRVGEILKIARDNIGDIVIILVVNVVAGFALSFVGVILNIIPCLGTIASFVVSLVAGPYLLVVSGHLYGQIATKAGPPKAAEAPME